MNDRVGDGLLDLSIGMAYRCTGALGDLIGPGAEGI